MSAWSLLHPEEQTLVRGLAKSVPCQKQKPTTRLVTAREHLRDFPSSCGRADRQQVRPELFLLAGIVGRVHVNDAKWSFAANLNDRCHFSERIMVDIRR